MGLLDDITSEQFVRWEQRGRGWKVWPRPVPPEPAFLPFVGYQLPQPSPDAHDDGRRPGLFASAFDALEKLLSPKPAGLPPNPEAEEPEPLAFESGPVVELQIALPASLDIQHQAFASFLEHVAACAKPVAFELLGVPNRVVAQFAVHADDTSRLLRQLKAYFPEVAFLPEQNTLANAWRQIRGETAILEFGLEREFMFQLASREQPDPFVGLIAAMNELEQGQLALFQVLFQPVQHDWPTSVWSALIDNEGKPLFVNRPELTIQAKKKLASPLYGAVLRIATRDKDFPSAWWLARELAFALRVFASPEGNALIPLNNDGYPFEAHKEDVVLRQSHRSGMLLNADELMGFVHFPSPAVRSDKLRRQAVRTRSAPAIATGGAAFVLGENRHMGKSVPVSLNSEQRGQHMHIIGAPGRGKSTLLFNLISQDIKNGQGVALFDPHGDLVEWVLGVIPPSRIDDVILVDPSDEDFVVGFNMLSAHNDFEKTLLASDLVSVFKRLSASWGDQMESVLNNAILAFLESSKGGTLSDLRRFLLEPAYRNEFLTTVRDPEVLYYWRTAFAQLAGNKSIGPVVTRLNAFLSRKPLRNMVSQPVNRLNFTEILDTGKIFLAKLPEGQIGSENAFLLGSLLVAKFQQAAMSRQRISQEQRRDFWLYIDEFHEFTTPSMAQILNGARKYRLGLILAHQELQQLQRNPEVGSAVLSVPYTRVVFRVGDEDARKLQTGFSNFQARDLQNLAKGEAICRVEGSDFDFNLSIPRPRQPDTAQEAEMRKRVIAASRTKYATPRAEVEAKLAADLNQAEPDSTTPPRPPPSMRKGSEPKPVPTPSEVPNQPETAPQQSTVVPPIASPRTTETAGPQSPASDIEAEESGQ